MVKKLFFILTLIIVILFFYFIYKFYSHSEHVDIVTYKIEKKLGFITCIRIKKDVFNYKVTNKNHLSYDFYMNANYFNKRPIGEVIVDGKTISPKNRFGGFFVSDGRTPDFHFNNRPINVKFSSQTHTVVFKESIPNNRIVKQRWAKQELPRLILGEDIDGNIIIIHSNLNGGISVKDAIEYGKKMKIYNGLMFDGGASIEIGIKMNGFNYHYQQVSDLLRKIQNTPTPSVFIVGNLKSETI